jgi:phage baseplate assembly protein gpV
MTVKNARWRLAGMSWVVLALAACGGNDDAAPAPAPRKAATASRTAATALWAAQAATLQLHATQKAQANVKKPAMAAVAGGPDVQPKVLLPCPNGGTMDVNITSLLPFTLAGKFAACTESVVAINGALSLSVTASFQDGSLLSFDSRAEAFEVGVGPLVQRLTGSTRVALGAGTAVTLDASSDALTTETLVSGTVQTSASLSGLKARLVIDGAAATLTSTIDFVASGSFAGLGEATLQLQTLAPLVTPFGAAFPGSGQVRITKDKLAVTTVTLQGATALVETDADGDGVIDSSEVVNVPDLAALVG